MITFIQFLITGLRLGSVYALIALGYTMVYGIIKLINFAHGDFIMVGGYTLFFTIPLLMGMGLPGWLAVIPAIVICAMNIASYICIGKFTSAKKLRPLAIATTILGGIVPGILMLLLKDDDLKPKSEKESDSADQEQKQ